MSECARESGKTAGVRHGHGSASWAATGFLRAASRPLAVVAAVLRALSVALSVALSLALSLALPLHAAEPTGAAPLKLRVVGGLGGVNQFTRHEEPFWTRTLPQLSGGRVSAEVLPFDRAGIRGQEMLALVRSGAVPFGTLLLAQAAPGDMELAAPDLAGLNPDMASLRRSVAAFRPHLARILRERHGIELLAVYTYPAQVLFCRRPLQGLASVRGLRVRTSGLSQNDWVEALGGQPVATPFAELLAQIKDGGLDCAITGTMSGNTIGLHELATHLHAQAVSWGLSIFVAHAGAWASLPPEVRSLLQRGLAELEQAIWAEAARETEEGIACNAGAAGCSSGRPGRMAVRRPDAADEQRRRELFASHVLPRWLERCGKPCVESWNRTLAPLSGLAAPPGR